MSTIVSIVVAMMTGAYAFAAGEVLTTCALASAPGKGQGSVQVQGRMGFTSHGLFLIQEEDCKATKEDIVILFPGTKGAPQVDFTLDTKALERLGPYFRTTGGTATACGVLEGKLFRKDSFRSRSFGGGLQGNGYGPAGAFRLAFVILAVSELGPCK